MFPRFEAILRSLVILMCFAGAVTFFGLVGYAIYQYLQAF